MNKDRKIIQFCANMKTVIIDYKTVWVPDNCECGEFRVFQKYNGKWHCAKCGKEIN